MPEYGPHNVAEAISLMREALAMLDRAGEHIAAARLQSAIDAARGGASPTRSGSRGAVPPR